MNAVLAHALAEALSALSNQGVPAIPLKGVALAEALYGDVSLRPSSDLDVLVPRAAVGRALDSLRAIGYIPQVAGRLRPDRLFRNDIAHALVRRAHAIEYSLDLHWGIASQASGDIRAMDELWAAAHRHEFRGVGAYGLSAEWELLFLALHAARHRWVGLKWLVDVHEICRRGDVDWAVVEHTARRFGWIVSLRITLELCHRLFATSVPEGLRCVRLPPWVEPFGASSRLPAAWQKVLHPARLIEGPIERARYFARVLLAPTLADYRFLPLPWHLRSLYCLLRPLRLGGKWSWYLACAALGRSQEPSQR